MGQLALGDSKYLLGNYDAAASHFKQVLTINSAYQVEAADRLETLSALKSLKIDINRVKDLTLSKTVRRDELANLLYNVYDVSRHIRSSREQAEEFTGISKSNMLMKLKDLEEWACSHLWKEIHFTPLRLLPGGIRPW
ncbi:MAG: hypothetical protein ACOCWZ_07405 [Spirochaetota bacterium]